MIFRLIFFFCIIFLFFDANAETLKADLMVINKAERKLLLYKGDKKLHSYRVALGSSPLGAKVNEGDGKTPEGDYKIIQKNNKSKFYLSLKVSYPEKKDLLSAKKLRLIPGGDIMIHGLGPYFKLLGTVHWMKDWTAGCIAVTDTEIKEIWDLVDIGTRVRINP